MKNIPKPEWNPADPSGSLRRFAEWVHEMAKYQFMKDGSHIHLFFLFQKDGEGSIVPVNGKIDHNRLPEALKEKICRENIYGIVHVAEGWSYFSPDPQDHTKKQLIHGEMRVSDLRDKDKTEVLLVIMQSRDDDYCCWLDPIIRNSKTGKVLLGQGVEVAESEGRFTNLFE